MKRPALFLTTLFVAIICSTVLVSTAISGICKSFFNKTEESSSVKIAPVSTGLKQASVRL